MTRDLVTQSDSTDASRKAATAAALSLQRDAYAHTGQPGAVPDKTETPMQLNLTDPYQSDAGTTNTNTTSTDSSNTDNKKQANESKDSNSNSPLNRPNPNPGPPQIVGPQSQLWDSPINAHGIGQGKYGDCFFESSLASLADTPGGDTALHNMIKQNSDGTYSVTFLGDKNHPVTVSQDEINKDKLTNPAQWANVMEAAYLKYNHDSASPIPGLGSLSSEGISDTGKVRTQTAALHLLTGQDAALDTMSAADFGNESIILGPTSKDNIRKDMSDALRRGEPVTASIGAGSSGPLPDEHVYSVLGFDQKNGTVVVRNPWGENDGNFDTIGQVKDGMTYQGNGVVTMSFDTFTKNFTDVAFAGKSNDVSQLEHVGQDALTAGKDGLSTVSSLAAGHPGDALDSAGRTAVDLAQNSVDQIHGLSDVGSRAVGSVISTGMDLAGKPFVTGRDEAATVTSLVTGHPGDAADHALDTAGDVADTVGSVVTAPFHALGGMFS